MGRTGLMIISHGSRDPSWVERLEHTLADLSFSMPRVISYLELVEGKSIPDGVKELQRQGVTDIIAIPLFVCSGSTHLDEIQYMLKVKAKPDLETDLRPMEDLTANVTFLSAMDDDPLMLDIAEERIRRLSQEPSEEVLMLAAHGSDHPGFHERWESVLQTMSKRLKDRMGFKAVTYGTMHPDNLRKRMEAVCRKHRVVLFPLFLSEGYFTRVKIPEKLEGLPFRYDGKTYLPHPNVASWVEEAVERALNNR